VKIGIIGCGIVGSACKFGFEKSGNEVIVHDIAMGTSISDVQDSAIVFVCVPTPQSDGGACDTSIVRSVVKELHTIGYKGVVSIKSTVTPGTTEALARECTGFADLCFVPEFLRERCAITDFIENHKLLAIGSHVDKTFQMIKECHGDYPESVLRLTPTQAELLKYYHNTFNALRVVFANEFYEICKSLDEDYLDIKRGLLKTSGVPDIYLDVNESMRGYSSICWNKDVPALIQLGKELSLNLPMINMIPEANGNFKKTPFKGTRE